MKPSEEGLSSGDEAMDSPPTAPPQLKIDLSLESKKIGAELCSSAYVQMFTRKAKLKQKFARRELSTREFKSETARVAREFQDEYDETLDAVRDSLVKFGRHLLLNVPCDLERKEGRISAQNRRKSWNDFVEARSMRMLKEKVDRLRAALAVENLLLRRKGEVKDDFSNLLKTSITPARMAYKSRRRAVKNLRREVLTRQQWEAQRRRRSSL